jgi:hypothetical protein
MRSERAGRKTDLQRLLADLGARDFKKPPVSCLSTVEAKTL